MATVNPGIHSRFTATLRRIETKKNKTKKETGVSHTTAWLGLSKVPQSL